MRQQYRTIIIEFQKDGLLGEKYIDEQEVEAVLNEEAVQDWELVTATMVPEGLMLFCKRAVSEKKQTGSSEALGTVGTSSQEDDSKQKTSVDDIKIF